MAYHVRCVARANTKALVIGDLPFGSYQISPEQGVESSIVLMKNGAQSDQALSSLIDSLTHWLSPFQQRLEFSLILAAQLPGQCKVGKRKQIRGYFTISTTPQWVGLYPR